jgi:hypothetical protein
MAVYRGGKRRVDDLYLINTTTNIQMKSLFANIMSGGSKFGGDVDSNSQIEEEEDELSMITEDKKEPSIHSGIKPKRDSFDQHGYSFLDDDGEIVEDSNEEENDEDIGGGLIAAKKVVVRDIKIDIRDEDHKPEPEAVRKDADDDSSVESWNNLTKLERQQDEEERDKIFSFHSIICVPMVIHCDRSLCWGSPKHYLQCSNFSTIWKVEVFWIDEDAAMVFRGEVKSGKTHFELCTADHVWAVVATMISPHKTYSAHSSIHQLGSAADSLTSPSHRSGQSESVIDEKLIMLLHPSAGSLQDGKCASLLWSPRTSLSVSQTLLSKPNKLRNIVRSEENRINPAIHIQIFDGIAKRTDANMSQSQISTDQSQKEILKRRPLRKSRNVKM